MREALLICAIAFIATAAIGPAIIRYLRKMKFGQKILEIGPKWHMNKQNIPTMGGFMFMLGITVSMLILGALTGQLAAGGHVVGNFFAVLLIALAYGLVGMVDDWAKIKKKQNAGLSAGQKMLLQIVVAAVFLSLLRLTGGLSAGLWIPGANVTLELPWVVYLIFSIVVVVGCDNAVNLTDGIDGLAASVTVPVALFFTIAAAWWGYTELGIFSGALMGGLLGFLIYNFHPAKVFMGDTGSLFLGGAVAAMGFAYDMPLILVPVGIIYIAETLSDILQVSYFKLTHGKRIFKMAPLHHHLELCGWSEVKLVGVFTSITVVCCALALWGISGRFPG